MTRLVAVLVATCLIAAACGGSDDGDVEAYCELVNNGVGTETSEFESLLEVAPPEIRDAVNELTNTTREFDDIEEIDELFDAAFDPDAQAARLACLQGVCYEFKVFCYSLIIVSRDGLTVFRSSDF